MKNTSRSRQGAIAIMTQLTLEEVQHIWSLISEYDDKISIECINKSMDNNMGILNRAKLEQLLEKREKL